MYRNILTRIFILCIVATLSACKTEYPPVFYQQIYSLDGVRTEALKKYDVGSAFPVPEFKSDLQLLYEAYPEQVKPFIRPRIYRQGAFFEQYGTMRIMGDGVGDLCNHAAWFVMNVMPAEKRRAAAGMVAKAMFDAREADTLKMLNSIMQMSLADGSIRVQYSYYDEENRELVKSRSEIYVGNDFKKNGKRLGLTRTYYESGMVASDTFYLYGAPAGYACTYKPNGGLASVRFLHADGKVTIAWQAGKAEETKE